MPVAHAGSFGKGLAVIARHVIGCNQLKKRALKAPVTWRASGLADNVRHGMACHVIQDTRAPNALDYVQVVGDLASARHVIVGRIIQEMGVKNALVDVMW